MKSPEIARKFVNTLPMTDVPAKYVVYKPLEQVTRDELPAVVVFLANGGFLERETWLKVRGRGTE